ncbi:hypothetical protein IV88_GL001486 [Pediococcus argentinicus]|uniref:HTH merR-type domain-containing protein n=2 Tax=Pediococcus argentinicus TaxID=480391 RepID=A0A0R2N4R2_9LACO|nr:hypothetical protein IV88_GL001486 [Pediococcus argentinicus]
MSEVVNATGLSKDTLRYYERLKIIPKPKRDVHGYRMFSEDDIDWINLIKLLREYQIPTKDLVGVMDTDMRERRDYLKTHQTKINTQIKKLRTLQNELKRKIEWLDKYQIKR